MVVVLPNPQPCVQVMGNVQSSVLIFVRGRGSPADKVAGDLEVATVLLPRELWVQVRALLRIKVEVRSCLKEDSNM